MVLGLAGEDDVVVEMKNPPMAVDNTLPLLLIDLAGVAVVLVAGNNLATMVIVRAAVVAHGVRVDVPVDDLPADRNSAAAAVNTAAAVEGLATPWVGYTTSDTVIQIHQDYMSMRAGFEVVGDKRTIPLWRWKAKWRSGERG